MDTDRATATAVDRALALPEIVALITLYLQPADILACSTVSRILRESFIPFVWQDLCFGPRLNDRSRCISSKRPDIISDIAVQSRTGTRNQILATFRNVAPLIRTLTIRNHESIFPLQLGAACSQLQSLDISGFFPGNTTPAHWINFKMMMRRNRDHLRSLSLISWHYDPAMKHQPGQYNWNPILGCTKSWTLRSLSLVSCSIRGRHMAAFWIVCSRLETLSMIDVYLHVDIPHSPLPRKNKCTVAKNICEEASPTNMATTVRFPHLRTLVLSGMVEPNEVRQLDLLITQCPALQTLHWTLLSDQRFSVKTFTDRLISSTWPELDSISIHGGYIALKDDELRGILLAAKRPLRRWSTREPPMTPETFDVYRTRHFSALEMIDITYGLGDTSQWTIEILTSCPSLRKLKAMSLRAEDIFKTNKPWICYGLQELVVFFDMGFRNRGPYRRFTEEELDKCQAIFRYLATLRELQVLDMLTTYPHFLSEQYTVYGLKPPLEDHLVPLPLRLKAGLGLLNGLRKLRMVGFWSGRHKMPMKELNWMVQHWRRLSQLAGGWILLSVPVGGLLNARIWSEENTTWLKEHKIITTGSQYQLYRDQGRELEDYEDCCGLSDGEDEGLSSGS